MNPFWTVSLFWAAAAACVAVALAFVLPPLLRKKEVVAKAARRDINIAVYRDQLKEMDADRANGLISDEQYQIGKIELEGRLAEDALAKADAVLAPVASRRLGFTLAGVLPVAAFGLYFWLGNPMSLIAIAQAQANPPAAATVPGGHDLAKMLEKVEEKTKSDPNNVEAWTMLAKTYAAMERWPDAQRAFQQAMKLQPDVPAIMTGYAEVLAVINGRVLKGEPMDLIMKALEKAPDDPKGLELAGINAFDEKNYAQAAYYFKHLLKQLPPDSPYAQDIKQAMAEATRLSRGAATGLDNLSDQAPEKAKAAGPGATLHGKVEIAAALKGKVSGKDVVFLFARSAGGGAPVAAIRSTAGKFPLEFELSDAMAMNPDNKLSNFKEVTLTARISKSGQPMAAAGDLEGTLVGVKVGSKDIKLTIDKVHQ